MFSLSINLSTIGNFLISIGEALAGKKQSEAETQGTKESQQDSQDYKELIHQFSELRKEFNNLATKNSEQIKEIDAKNALLMSQLEEKYKSQINQYEEMILKKNVEIITLQEDNEKLRKKCGKKNVVN